MKKLILPLLLLSGSLLADETPINQNPVRSLLYGQCFACEFGSNEACKNVDMALEFILLRNTLRAKGLKGNDLHEKVIECNKANPSNPRVKECQEARELVQFVTLRKQLKDRAKKKSLFQERLREKTRSAQ